MLARWTGGELVRLQCYEGIDASQAVYEWDYSRQLLHLRAVEAGGGEVVEDELYSERFLVKRPLMRAIAYEADALGAVAPPVLLVDEVDRADDEFEAFLLEILSDYTVTVPELGTFHAEVPPLVVVTSNRTRDVHDALEAPLPLPLDRAPRLRARARDPAHARARGARAAGARGCGRGRRHAGARALQAARSGGDDRLGERPRRARSHDHRRTRGRGHARHHPQVPRRPGAHACCRHRAAGPQLVGTSRGSAVPDRLDHRRHRRRPARGRVRRASCGARGSTSRSGRPSSSPRRSARSGCRRATRCTGRDGRRS